MAPIFCKDCAIKVSGFFKKKFTCRVCSNHFCEKCISKAKENAADFTNRQEVHLQYCLACVVLRCGRIKREQLFLLRNKQLAEYLNKRNVSTERCSEKYHLVDLVMEFAETHGIKSEIDVVNEIEHKDQVEELIRKAELLRIQEVAAQRNNEQSGEEYNTEEPHFSGASSEGSSRDAFIPGRGVVDTESSESEPESGISSAPIESDNEDASYGAGHQQNETSDNIESGGDNSHFSPSRQENGTWFSVEDIQTEEYISSLSVLELKQILNANFVDYHGVCEKKELIKKARMIFQAQQAENSDDDAESSDPESEPESGISSAPIESDNEDTNYGAGHQQNETSDNIESGGDNSHFSPSHQASGTRFSVDDIQNEENISSLSVLELKQILDANFIDYHGVCEKKELVNKVRMFYQSQKAEKSDQDAEDDRDLCKICMDKIIDCVFLDCAHLVACTECGKQLSECPICRASILRIVHIFRA